MQTPSLGEARFASPPGRVKRLDSAGGWWRSVLAATGQPERFG